MLLFGPTCKLKTSYISIQVWNASVPEWVNEPNQTVWTGSLKKKSNIFISTILLEWLCVSMTYKINPHPPHYFVTLSKLKESRFFSYHPPTFSDNVILYDVFFLDGVLYLFYFLRVRKPS